MLAVHNVGFLTFAQNTSKVDYLRLAYLQAMNIKSVMPGFAYAVVVDSNTAEQITDNHRRAFDHIIELIEDYNTEGSGWLLANECQAYDLTPFDETIKLESDLLFTRSIAHWLDAFRIKDIVLSYGCRDYTGQLSSNRDNRRLFDDNDLPDTYNGLMYFRRSETAQQFFAIAKTINQNWSAVRDQILKNCREDYPSTDVLYAVAAQVLGRELCTLPSVDFINFTHMKPNIQNWHNVEHWTEMIMNEHAGDMIRINNLNQYHPVHYYDKHYASDELIKYYEQRVF